MQARAPIESPALWRAADVVDPSQWTQPMTDEQRIEVVAAAWAAEARGRTPATLRPADFELPSLRYAMAVWNEVLERGRGFILLRGFPVDELTPAQIELAYVGLGMQLGTPVSQDAKGSVLGHVRDEGVERLDPTVRLYQTNQRQDFHTDAADIIGLLCIRPALAGGESRIASAAAVYNEILARRPDLLEVLYEPMFWDRNGEESEGEDPYFALPVLSDVGGVPRMFFIGWYIRDAQRHPEVPRLTGDQLAALELIEEIANDPGVHLEMAFEPGDIQLLANAKILHCREAYRDDPDPARRRHLLRLWLSAHRFASVDNVLRGGIPTKKGA